MSCSNMQGASQVRHLPLPDTEVRIHLCQVQANQGRSHKKGKVHLSFMGQGKPANTSPPTLGKTFILHLSLRNSLLLLSSPRSAVLFGFSFQEGFQKLPHPYPFFGIPKNKKILLPGSCSPF